MHRIPLSLVTLAVAAALISALAPAPLAASICALDACGEHGPSIDPNGLAAASCELDSCGERGPIIDPDGLAASICALDSCGEHGPISDPDGLAARPEAQGPVAPVLATLRVLLPV